MQSKFHPPRSLHPQKLAHPKGFTPKVGPPKGFHPQKFEEVGLTQSCSTKVRGGWTHPKLLDKSSRREGFTPFVEAFTPKSSRREGFTPKSSRREGFTPFVKAFSCKASSTPRKAFTPKKVTKLGIHDSPKVLDRFTTPPMPGVLLSAHLPMADVYRAVNCMDAAQTTLAMRQLMTTEFGSNRHEESHESFVKIGQYLLKKGARLNQGDRSLIVDFLDGLVDEVGAFALLRMLKPRLKMMYRDYDFDWAVHLTAVAPCSGLDMLTLLARIDTFAYMGFLEIIVPSAIAPAVKTCHLHNTLVNCKPLPPIFLLECTPVDVVRKHMDPPLDMLIDCFGRIPISPESTYEGITNVCSLLHHMLSNFPLQTHAYSRCFSQFAMHIIPSAYARSVFRGSNWSVKMDYFKSTSPQAFRELTSGIQRDLLAAVQSGQISLGLFVIPMHSPHDTSALRTLYNWGWVPMGWDLLSLLHPHVITHCVHPALYEPLLPYDVDPAPHKDPSFPIRTLFNQAGAEPTQTTCPFRGTHLVRFVEIAAHWTDACVGSTYGAGVCLQDYINLIRLFVRGVSGFVPAFLSMLESKVGGGRKGMDWLVGVMVKNKCFVPDRDVLSCMIHGGCFTDVVHRVPLEDVEWVCQRIAVPTAAERLLLTQVPRPLEFTFPDRLATWVFWIDTGLMHLMIQTYRACTSVNLHLPMVTRPSKIVVQSFVYRVLFRSWLKGEVDKSWCESLSLIPLHRPRRNILSFLGCCCEGCL